jgi:PEP-CTERM motif
MSSGRFCVLLAMVILVFAPSTLRGITLGQVDTFEDGTKQGWDNGSAIGVGLGGPAGSGDHYLPVLAGGSGLPLRLEILNRSQWLGNYLAAGVTGIEMDLRAGAPELSTLSIRIAIRESTSSSILSGYASTVPFTVPNDQQWHHVSFSLLSGNLTPVSSPQPLATDLANVVDFRIIDAAVPATQGDFVALAGFDIDNIHAVPEPASISILLSGIIGIALLRRRMARWFRPTDLLANANVTS